MPVDFHQKHCIRGAIPVQFLGTRHCGNCGKWFNASDFYGIYDWKKPRPNTHWPYCLCPSCWPNSHTYTGEPMYGPNFTNPMNQSGQFVSEINRLNNHKEAKQMENTHQCEHCTAYRVPSADCKMKDQKTHMDTQAIPFSPPPHQPKLSAESQEKYAAGNKTVEETIRGQILDTAKGLTTGDRNKSYGPPIDNLTTYANLIAAYIEGRNAAGTEYIDAVDAAIFMVLAKVSRIAANRGHKDNYVDGAAYMAIAGECDELLGGG